MGFYVGLSSNGTLIDEHNIDRIAAVDFDYVGVSLDGIRDTHDRFAAWRGLRPLLAGLRRCRDLGVKVGCASP
jgi:MoaA/NifB/PqqE/SkfB family radical SAM enzyme